MYMYISVNNTSQKRQGKDIFLKLLNESYRRNISNAVKVRIRFRKNRKKNKHYDKQKRKKNQKINTTTKKKQNSFIRST